MDTISSRIQQFSHDLKNALSSVSTLEHAEQLRITYIGRSGLLSELTNLLKTVPTEEKRIIGPQLQELKAWAEDAVAQCIERLKQAHEKQLIEKQKQFDVTAYQHQPLRGSRHLYTQIIEQLEDIFISMGYSIADGPEVVTDYYNFSAVNIPISHPARDSHDTFWLDVPGLLMRTHTTSIQARVLESATLPLAVLAPGRCYRNEATDASHDFMFTQAEGLVVGKDISMANLLATAQAFLQALFETDNLKIRVRPGYFPFVEPGVEIDASCPFCSGGCSTCKKTGWIELLGAGLVHPNVLKCSNINPLEYSGFAFGMGIERIAMIKYGIRDIRLFHSNASSFLEQF